MIKNAKNPQAMLQQMMSSNPQMQEVQKLIQQNGGDAEKAFRAKAAELGVDPTQIIDALK